MAVIRPWFVLVIVDLSKAWSTGARKAFLLLAAFSTSATVAASVRSFVVSEKPVISGQPDMSGKLVMFENFITSERPAIAEGPAIPEQFAIFGRPASTDKLASARILPALDPSSSFAAVSTKAYASLAPNKPAIQ